MNILKCLCWFYFYDTIFPTFRPTLCFKQRRHNYEHNSYCYFLETVYHIHIQIVILETYSNILDYTDKIKLLS